ISSAIISSYPESFQSLSTFCGYTSMSFTTQSLSVPVVEAYNFAVTCPASVTSSFNSSVCHIATSGRSFTNRWSCTSHVYQLPGWSAGYVVSTGRCRYGTGCAGSLSYASNASRDSVFGASNESFPFSPIYKLFVFASRGGHASKLVDVSLPVWKSNASFNGKLPLSCSQYANHGASTFCRKYTPVSDPNGISPSAFPGPPDHPPCFHGPTTK